MRVADWEAVPTAIIASRSWAAAMIGAASTRRPDAPGTWVMTPEIGAVGAVVGVTFTGEGAPGGGGA